MDTAIRRQKKAIAPCTGINLRGKEKRGMVWLLVSLGRAIKTMISNTYIVVSSQGTAMARWRVESRHFSKEKAMVVRLKCNALMRI